MRSDEVVLLFVGIVSCTILFLIDPVFSFSVSMMEIYEYVIKQSFLPILIFPTIIFLSFLVLFFVHQAVSDIVFLKIGYLSAISSIDYKKIRKLIFETFRKILFIAFALIPQTLLLVSLSFTFKGNTKDILLLKLDQVVLGTSPFLTLPNMFQSEWLTYILWYSYANLSLVVGLIFLFLFIFSREYLFKVFALSFVFSFFIAWPFFIHFPCMDPGNTYIRGYDQKDESRQVQQEIEQSYTPSVLTSELIYKIQIFETIHDKRNNRTTLSFSCFPSMHAVWGILLVVILSMYRRLFIIPSAIYFVLMLIGGLYFAQHYFVDYLIAIPVATFSVIFSIWVVKRDKKASPQANKTLHEVINSFKEVFNKKKK